MISPNIYNARLWQTSGHWDHYSDDMFKIDVDKEQFGLKPMNCPGTCRAVTKFQVELGDFFFIFETSTLLRNTISLWILNSFKLGKSQLVGFLEV